MEQAQAVAAKKRADGIDRMKQGVIRNFGHVRYEVLAIPLEDGGGGLPSVRGLLADGEDGGEFSSAASRGNQLLNEGTPPVPSHSTS